MSRSKYFAGFVVPAFVFALSLTAFASSEWNVKATQASVDIVQLCGQWRKCTGTFNSGAYNKARIYIGAYGLTTGRCWVDNLKPSGFTIENPSFENLSSDGKSPAGWSLDEPGRTMHVASDQVSEGGHSVMIYDASASADMIRMSQVVDVQPNTDYSYTYDFYMDTDFVSGIRCGVYAEDPLLPYLGGQTEDLDQIIADRSRAGNRQHRMKLDGGSASMTRTVSVPTNAIMEAVADIKIKSLTGAVKYTVEDASSGKILGSVTETSGNGYWKLLSIRFASLSKAVRLRVSGEGTGEVLVSEVEVLRPRFVPQPQNVAWRNADKAMRMKTELSYRLAGNTGELLNEGIQILAKDLASRGIKLLKTEGKSPDLVVSVGQSPKAPRDRGPESYYLSVDKRGIDIQAETDRGALYGVMTLLQLFADDRNGKSVVVGCKISDWPDFPYRSLFKGVKLTPEWLVRRKINYIANVDMASEPLADYRKYGITAVLHQNIVHVPYKGKPGILSDPNMCEGVGQTDELILKGEAPVELSGRNVLRSKLTGIVVTSADGKTTFTEGRDYRVIPGEIVFTSGCEFSPEYGNFAISRLSGGRIADGQTVIATYEHIRLDCSMMCLAEPLPKAEVARLAQEMVEKNDLSFIGLHASECAACIGKGPRCQATGKSPSQLLADYYHELDKAIKKSNPGCRMISWTDDFMPWQNSPRSGLADVAKLMPKDAIMETWWYGPGGTVDFNVKTASLWSGLGYDFTLMSWYDYANIRETAAVALWARENGMPCLGLNSWAYPSTMLSGGDVGYLDETARCAWRAPRRGETGYVDVNAILSKAPQQ